MIPEAAVEAAAEWLPHSGDCEVRPERDCTCWRDRVNLMRAALEAAAPHIIEAWINDTSRLPNDLPGYGPRGQAKSGPIYPLGKIEDKR